MNTEEIIEMARQADALSAARVDWDFEWVETFAKLVAAKATDEANARSNTSWTLMCKKMVEDEREACAKVCDELPAPDIYSDTDKSMWEVACMDCSEAIIARGETK